jgi:hypothetical protein
MSVVVGGDFEFQHFLEVSLNVTVVSAVVSVIVGGDKAFCECQPLTVNVIG